MHELCANHIMHSKERPTLTFKRLPAVSFSYKKWLGRKIEHSRVPFAFIYHLLGNNAISRHYRFKNEAHMAVLCTCEAFGLCLAPFISDNIQLECKRFRNVVFISVRFFWFFRLQFIRLVTSSQHFKNYAYVQACLASICCFQVKKATCRQRLKNEA